MRRVLTFVLPLAVIGCADLATELSDGYTAAPPGMRAFTFTSSAYHTFHSSTNCTAGNPNITCYLKIENAGELSSLDLSVYGFWDADATCVHSKTGKTAPSKQQPASNPQRLEVNYWPSGGISVTNGEAEISSLVLEPPAPSARNNPCSANKGAYTSVRWENVTPHSWQAIAFDGDAIFGSALAYDTF